ILEVQPKGEVGVPGIPGCTLPPLCLAYAWFGVRCPGCGLTHSFVHLAHGHWQASWNAHHLGWLLAGLLLLQIPYRIHSLYVWPDNLLTVRVRQRIGRCLIGLLIGNWLLQVLF
ncbi:MAG TPA: DUF2752 domain-containing protein, partial [Chthoniobacteraceae bacterium]|nr:DUF2752 domain-containing protein [Chthoniobacteraceae bacterium]